jgi:large subunit ribosomal protein L2
MAIKFFNPYTSSTRQKTTIDFSILSKIKPEKKLIVSNYRSYGRNNQGRITCRHKGSGHKRLYRLIDFKRKKLDIFGKVLSIEYDPNRTSFISLIKYNDGEKKYIISPENIEIGQEIVSSSNSIPIIGNTLPLANIPLGTPIHNIELKPGKGGQIARSAGCFATILAKEKNYAIIKLSSKEVRLIHKTCLATIGKVSNPDNSKIILGKAGRSRWLGIRPTVRGSAMNPIDHPHGGGEGRSPIGKPCPVTPWGKPTLGKKTRKKTNKNTKYILHSRSK